MIKYKLTPRQTEVIKKLARGLQNKQIAYEMNVSEATIKLHMSGLFFRLGVKNRTAAVLKAMELNLI